MRTLFTTANILTLVGAFIAITTGVANSEFRTFFNIQDMTGIRFIAASLYIMVCIVVWVYIVSPLIPENNPSFINANPDDKSKLIFSNMSIDVTENGDVTLRTVINMFSNGLLKPAKKLMPANFNIQEEFNKEIKKTSVLSVTPMESASQITILIDASNSMWGQTQIERKGEKIIKMDIAKESIIEFSDEFIKSQRPNQASFSYLSFIVFSGNGIFYLKNNNNEIWFPAIEESRNQIKYALDKVKPDGDTPMYGAISHALDILNSDKKAKHQLILCLTDGIDNISSITPEELSQKIQNNNIPIITIGYGHDNEIDKETLNTISTLSGAGAIGTGSFTNIEPKELPAVFNYILNNINNTYEVKWKSAFPIQGKNITAKLQAIYDTVLGKKVSPIINLNYTIPSSK